MLEPLLEPLAEPFFARALLAVALGGVTCACLGAYVVLRRMAFVSTALTHSILPGVVGASLLGFSPYLGALAAALVTAAGAAWLAARRGASEDSAVGVMLSVMFAAGVALMQQANSWRDFAGLLFGSVVAVGADDLRVIGVTAAVVLLGLRLLHKELELASFDEEYATLLGARPALLRVVLLTLVALGAVSCVRLVGALLTTALFVIPAATGVLLGRTVPQVMAWGVACALAGGGGGLYLSYHFPAVPSGAGIVLCCALPYLAARLFAPRR
ncbi:MAG: metal ABC transporter permease [Verrucomicrobiota bacterium]